MERVIGIFEQRHVDTVLNDLRDFGYSGRDITLVDQNGSTEGTSWIPASPVATTPNNSVIPPAIVGPAAAGTVGGNGAENSLSPTGDAVLFPSLFGFVDGAEGVDRALEFYQSSVNNGATLVIVRCNKEDLASVREIMKRAHASNVSGDTSSTASAVG
jgi:hypothetical protein